MSEIPGDYRHCNVCLQLKYRIATGEFFPNKKDRKFTDETGHLWNGKVCPSCFKEQTRLRMKERRQKKKL